MTNTKHSEGRDMTKISDLLGANEIWEFLYGELKGAVPEELTDEVLGNLATHIKSHFAPPPSSEAGDGVDLADLQLLMRLKNDNVWDGARPVVERNFEQCFRLSEAGLIALEQVARGVRLHITRLGMKAISRALPTIKEPTDE
jgi:hypothetical protein